MVSEKETNKIFCEFCDEFVEFDVKKRSEERKVLGEKIEIESDIAVCKKCGEELFCSELDKKNQKIAFDKYREKNNILFVEEIKEIRNKYGLTQKEISNLLGWGEITYHRYEKGSIPDRTHNNQLKLIKNPRNVKVLLKDNHENLSQDTIDKLNDKITKMIEEKNNINLNLPNELYTKIKVKADKNGMSMDGYIIYLITKQSGDEKIKEENERIRNELRELVLMSKTTANESWSGENMPFVRTNKRKVC